MRERKPDGSSMAGGSRSAESAGPVGKRTLVEGLAAPIMRKATGAAGTGSAVEAQVDKASQSSGAPLPGPLRGELEPALGADLSGVRVHTGAESAAASDALSAKAYAVGQDVHFGAGAYDPSSASGKHLIAH